MCGIALTFKILLFFLCDHRNGSAEREQSERVRDHHKLIEGVGQLPDEIVGEQGTEKDKSQRDHGVGNNAFFAKQGDDVLFAEEIPADDGGEGKEQETNGNEAVSDHASKGLGKRRLCKIGFA